ncbi:MAG: hypothetical protein SGJ15_05050 [Bacteroidota bacterium]|nr:hypothetical protein [Bacteroidota bacterium]
MALLSNRIACACLLLFLSNSVAAQEAPSNAREYHNKEQFKKFGKRADLVAAWQIQNLKFGAVVVRFQNNRRKIDAYRKSGQEKKALEVIAETDFYTKLMMKAYAKEFTFCKVYFMFAQSSDSLLKGVRKGIFIDTTLKANEAIVMNESFYILAEKDHVYNSTIGFVKEDTARYISEGGNKTVDAAVVLKNKYGHQLKPPFPYYVKKSFVKSSSQYEQTVSVETSPGIYEKVSFYISKDVTPEKQGTYLNQLSNALQHLYQGSQGVQVNDPTVQPFLY